MKKIHLLVPALLFAFVSSMACSKDDKDTNDNNPNPNENRNSKITITATKNGNQLDVTTVELIDNAFVPADWAITSGYNSMGNIFTLNVSHVSTQPTYNLAILKQMPALGEGTYNLKEEQMDNTVYRNVKVNPNASYFATQGTLKIDKKETIGSAGGASAHYLDGSFSFDAVNQADSTDVIQIQATFTGVATAEI